MSSYKIEFVVELKRSRDRGPDRPGRLIRCGRFCHRFNKALTDIKSTLLYYNPKNNKFMFFDKNNTAQEYSSPAEAITDLAEEFQKTAFGINHGAVKASSKWNPKEAFNIEETLASRLESEFGFEFNTKQKKYEKIEDFGSF